MTDTSIRIGKLDKRFVHYAHQLYGSTKLKEFCVDQPDFESALIETYLPSSLWSITSQLDPKWGVWGNLVSTNRQKIVDLSFEKLVSRLNRKFMKLDEDLLIFDDTLEANRVLGLRLGVPLCPFKRRFYLIGNGMAYSELLSDVLTATSNYEIGGGGLIGRVVGDTNAYMGIDKLKIIPAAFIFKIFDNEHIAIAVFNRSIK
jgi:hypothetical protein